MSDALTQSQVRSWQPWKIVEAGQEVKDRCGDFRILSEQTGTRIRDAGSHWSGEAYWAAYDRIAGDRDIAGRVAQLVEELGDAMINAGSSVGNYRAVLLDKVAATTGAGFDVDDDWTVRARSVPGPEKPSTPMGPVSNPPHVPLPKGMI